MVFYYYPQQSDSYAPFERDSHPYHPQHQRQQQPFGFPGAERFPTHGFRPFRHGPPPAPFYPPYGYATTGAYDDLADEERAARAHLESIQRRREAADAYAAQAVEREREQRAAEIRRQIRELEAEREREVARERQQRQREAERQAAIAAATAARQEALRQRQAAISAAQAARTRAFEERQRYIAAINDQRRRQCARHGAQFAQRGFSFGPHFFRQPEEEKPEQTKETEQPEASNTNQFDEWNKYLNLFGINIVKDTEDSAPTAVEPKAESSKAAEASTSTAAEEPARPESTEESKQILPNEINDILSAFLGLRVEPTDQAESSAAGAARGVPAGLNELLGRFGLEFVPDEVEEKAPATEEKAAELSTAAPAQSAADPETPALPAPTPAPAVAPTSAAPQPQARETPFTNLLNNHTELHPFVRDIFANIERSFGENHGASDVPEEFLRRRAHCHRRRDKGKGVAEGEKKPRTEQPSSVPAPAPAPAEEPAVAEPTTATSLTALDKIESDLAALKSSFTFPSKLSFATSSTDTTPALLFNRTNSPYHAQANALLQLLLAADGVSSGGDRSIRSRRKALVKAVEAAIEELEKRRDSVWEDVKERRERGESEDEDEDGHTSGSSTNGDVEHIEHAEVEHEEKAETEQKAAEDEKTTGYEVPATEPEAPVESAEKVEDKPAEVVPEVVEPEAEAEVQHPTAAEEPEIVEPTEFVPKPTVTEDKEEGYELL